MATTEQVTQQPQQDEELQREGSPTYDHDDDSCRDPPPPQKITTITSSRPDEPTEGEEDEEEEEERVVNIITTNSGPSSGTVTPRHHGRDSTWLEIEVCREFCRGDCSRPAEECRYAHPTQSSVIVKDGRVTCCFDFLKDRCTRESCKYLHPPTIIKDRLIMAGKHYGQQMSATTKPLSPVPLSPTIIPLTAGISPYPLFIDSSPTSEPSYGDMSPNHAFTFPPHQQQQMTYCVQVCENFDNNITCPSGANCFYAHSEPYVRRDANNTVSCCWNYLKGYCRHNQCWFYHPPQNILLAILYGGIPPPHVLMEPFLMNNAYRGDEKSPYSPTSSLGQYSYSFFPTLHHHAPNMGQLYSPTNTSFPPPPVTGFSTLPQAIVQ